MSVLPLEDVRDGELRCSKCREWKPDSKYECRSDSITRRHRQAQCKACCRARLGDWVKGTGPTGGYDTEMVSTSQLGALIDGWLNATGVTISDLGRAAIVDPSKIRMILRGDTIHTTLRQADSLVTAMGIPESFHNGCLDVVSYRDSRKLAP